MFSETIWSNVDRIFCRRRQFLSKFKAYIAAPLAWKKVSISADIVAGDNMCRGDNIIMSSQTSLYIIEKKYIHTPETKATKKVVHS